MLQLVVIYFQTRSRILSSKSTQNLPSVSILKPLKGLDDQLEENLHSFFQLNYPEYEIIMGFNDPEDPAIDIAEKLVMMYPNHRSRIVINRQQIGLNPKINNLANMYPSISYNHILISDSNIRVSKDYLLDLVEHLQDENVGLVTSPIRGMGAKGFGALLENLHLNSFILASVFVAHKIFKIPISIGKSMLLKKKTLESIGGFKDYKNFLAEDYIMSEAIQKLGLKVTLSSHFVNNINQHWDVAKFLNRHSRWAKMRKTSNLLYYLSEVLSNPISIAVLFALVFPSAFSQMTLCITLFIKVLIDGLIIHRVHSDLRFYHLGLIPLKDLLIGLTWLTPFFSRTVKWRGNLLKITKNTKLLPLTQGG